MNDSEVILGANGKGEMVWAKPLSSLQPPDMNSENPHGWACVCDCCGKSEIFPQLTLGEALRAMHASGRWARTAPMALQEKDFCKECSALSA